jgi:SH3-like domain-containing protein
MKKIFFTLALLVQVGFAMADGKEKTIVKVRHNNIKLFQQAGTSTPVLATISSTDEVEFVRKYENDWAVVTVNGKTGYVLISEIYQLKAQKAKIK